MFSIQWSEGGQSNLAFGSVMDDLSVFGDSFDNCLNHLKLVLARCVEKGLVLNWEKCHFMVTFGIVLGHVVFSKGIEVDKEKVDLILYLPLRQ